MARVWQTNFRNLPEIPIYKKWIPNVENTREQSIADKLLNGQILIEEEIHIFLELTNFYTELYNQLSILDYSTFNEEDLENFQNYIFYAFNYTAIITNDLEISQTYRLGINEFVTGNNERITDIKFLKYPDLNKVRKSGKYNRANTPNTNVFYSTDTIDTALKELRPPLNKLVTIGVWKPKEKKKFRSYPIFHSNKANANNEGAKKAMEAFENNLKYAPPLLINYLQNYFKLLGREYSKKINNHYEYIISALFSEDILLNNDLNIDCIIYPSVGNDHVSDNLALRPSVLNNDFYLKKVIEFEIEESYYDNKYNVGDSEKITLAKIKNMSWTENISNNGKINW